MSLPPTQDHRNNMKIYDTATTQARIAGQQALIHAAYFALAYRDTETRLRRINMTPDMQTVLDIETSAKAAAEAWAKAVRDKT
jgi:hypothetical protein